MEEEVLLEVPLAEDVHGVGAQTDEYASRVAARRVVQQTDEFLADPLPVVVLHVVAKEHQDGPGGLRADRLRPLPKNLPLKIC